MSHITSKKLVRDASDIYDKFLRMMAHIK